eukprot:TRINITY_DN2026_c0_g1_i4.p1 TRINITY_DN2026_c0_g1~~TRINITY_DN2026_c0_g1_i4.p1  ORF type:complete len:207 (-),score=13.45 TRINITY_DN2026_c0_g1_i4:201-821(-)
MSQLLSSIKCIKNKQGVSGQKRKCKLKILCRRTESDGKRRISQARIDALKRHIWTKWVTVDGGKLMGDLVMVWATQIASNRVPQDDKLIYGTLMVACWVSIAWMRGDYSIYQVEAGEEWLHMASPYYSTYKAFISGFFTWVFSTPILLLMFSILVSNNMLVDNMPLILPISDDANLPAELEVIVAFSITVSCWRAMYAAFASGLFK